MHQNRKSRRAFAKAAKLTKKKQKATFTDKMKMNTAAINAGRQIHQKFVEDNNTQIDMLSKEQDQHIISSFVANGYTHSEADQIVKENNAIKASRQK